MAAIGSRNTQQNTVSAGLALGFSALGVYEIRCDKVTFELAFDAAWRAWPHASAFPALSGDSHLDRWWLIREYTAGKRTPYSPAIWSGPEQSVPTIYARSADVDWAARSPQEYAGDLVDGIPGESWVALAQAMCDRASIPTD